MGIFQDWTSNKGNLKGRIILVMFRLAQVANKHILLAVILCIYLGFYHVFVEWFLGVEIPRKLKAGKGLVIFHGQALVINQGVVIGSNCILRNSITIGHKKRSDGSFSPCPVIGDNVDIGANSVIIGDIEIGDNVIIGAGSVVVKSVPANCVVAGNPAKIIRQI